MARGLGGDDLREFYRLAGPWLKPRQMTRGEELPLSRDNRIVVRPIRKRDTAALFAALSRLFLLRHFARYAQGSVQSTLNQREFRRALRDAEFPTEVLQIVSRGKERPGDIVLQRVCAPGYGRRSDGVNCGRPFLLLKDGTWIGAPPTQLNVSVPVASLPATQKNPLILLTIENAREVQDDIEDDPMVAELVKVSDLDSVFTEFEPDDFSYGIDRKIRIEDCEDKLLKRFIRPNADWRDPWFEPDEADLREARRMCLRLHDRLEELLSRHLSLRELARSFDQFFEMLDPIYANQSYMKSFRAKWDDGLPEEELPARTSDRFRTKRSQKRRPPPVTKIHERRRRMKR